jgi:predicted AlkP superfamily pyrophosphatase or phosphodiesterase
MTNPCPYAVAGRVRTTLLPVLLAALSISAAAHAAEPPRLILQITVDQLRGDLPLRYAARFGEGGFRYLMEQGIHYTNANYDHANTETVVGHTSLATGSVPAGHGMVGNVWFDQETGELTYNIEDSRYQLLTRGADVDASAEIDPTQRVARSEGRSPAAILVSTFSDELAIHYAGRPKIFGVSVKDRGAVPLAGHAGKAFWFSKAAGEFVTSSYYYSRYPDWVVRWNDRGLPARYGGTRWQLLRDRDQYLFGAADNRDWETDFPGFGRTFPHDYGSAEGKYFSTLLTLSPAGDELTAEFAKAVIENESLGADAVPDYLAVSFSSTDYVGHLFGPSSLESEDNLLRLDRTLADLFAFVDERVGLDKTLIVLSADHGGPEVPGYLKELGIDADYVDVEALDTVPAMAALKQSFGIGKELIQTYSHPYIYLNRDVIAERGLDQARVETAVAEELRKLPGIAFAFSSLALARGGVADTLMTRAVLRNYHAKRSGDIYVVFEPQHFINDFDGLTVAATHGSPWRYDTYVPVMFAGQGISPARVSRAITPYDIAATLAARIGTKPPSGLVGSPLAEVLGD